MDYKKIWSEVITASLIIVISVIAIISFIIISGQDVNIYNPSSKIAVSKGTDKISEVLNLIQKKYLGEIEVDKLVDGAIYGIFDSIDDPYTRYLTDEEYDEAVNSGNKEFCGIGMHISLVYKTGEAKIIGIMPDTPAMEAGLKAGDILKKVEDLEVNKETYYEALDKLKGEENTTVNITIERDNKELSFEVTRKNITSSEISSMTIDNNIGYIKIFEFEKGVYNSFKEEYNKLLDKNVSGIIIDLRDNPGGFVEETVRIADLLCGSGTIIKEIYGDGTTKLFTSDANKCEIPLVVLVNENSASASEILSGAIKDLNAGKLVGTTTFGKGIMQSYIKLESEGAVAITVAKYYTASNSEIHGKGIEPDVYVKPNLNDVIDFSGNQNKDNQLKEAVNLLKNMNN